LHDIELLSLPQSLSILQFPPSLPLLSSPFLIAGLKLTTLHTCPGLLPAGEIFRVGISWKILWSRKNARLTMASPVPPLVDRYQTGNTRIRVSNGVDNENPVVVISESQTVRRIFSTVCIDCGAVCKISVSDWLEGSEWWEGC
jgi:hypothetical protein